MTRPPCDALVLPGDALTILATLPAASVQCVVTSPPYWGLRDYKVPGQLGLEATPEEYVAKMVAVFREVRRVLRGDGTVWLNMGDCYNAAGREGHGTRIGYKQGTNRASAKGNDENRPTAPNLKPKDLVGIPWRLAFALQADGWWLRSDIVWAKPNPMPESVTDRPTKAHEYVFLLSKRASYYYDQEAVREAPSENTHRRHAVGGEPSLAYKMTEPGSGTKNNSSFNAAMKDLPPGTRRNLRTVWTIPTEPFPEAHFATFPRRLVLPCILAGTSAKGCCPNCGAPWERVVEKARTFESGSGRSGILPAGKNDVGLQGGGETVDVRRGPVLHTETTGWRPTCYHADGSPHDCIPLWDPVPCTVLDPFCGSGTVGVVATQLGRHFLGIELNQDYCAMAERRIRNPEPEPCAAVPEEQLGLGL